MLKHQLKHSYQEIACSGTTPKAVESKLSRRKLLAEKWQKVRDRESEIPMVENRDCENIRHLISLELDSEIHDQQRASWNHIWITARNAGSGSDRFNPG